MRKRQRKKNLKSLVAYAAYLRRVGNSAREASDRLARLGFAFDDFRHLLPTTNARTLNHLARLVGE